jgi:hypothetical protein
VFLSSPLPIEGSPWASCKPLPSVVEVPGERDVDRAVRADGRGRALDVTILAVGILPLVPTWIVPLSRRPRWLRRNPWYAEPCPLHVARRGAVHVARPGVTEITAEHGPTRIIHEDVCRERVTRRGPRGWVRVTHSRPARRRNSGTEWERLTSDRYGVGCGQRTRSRGPRRVIRSRRRGPFMNNPG